jgi:hypothetical protein
MSATTRKRRLRGWVLKALQKQYPADLELTELSVELRSLFPGGLDTHELAVECAYLEEKGYLTLKREEVVGEEIVALRLTAKGRDLMEGSGPPDPGVATALVGQ